MTDVATVATGIEPCVTCGREIDSPFCPACGERRASDRSYSLLGFVREHVIEAIASFDGRAIRTCRMLLAKPGELTAAFMRGVRLPYLAPLQLFLLFNLAFFLWSSAVGIRIFDTPLSVHVGGQPYSGIARRLVTDHLRAVKASPPDQEAYAARFNAIGSAQARSLVLAMVPAFALLAGILLMRRRRTPVVQHIVFALHTYAFLFVLLAVSVYVIDIPLAALLRALGVAPGVYGYDAEQSLAMLAIFCVYLALSSRRAYGIGRARAAVTAAVLGFGMYGILQAYRALLFFVTYYSM